MERLLQYIQEEINSLECAESHEYHPEFLDGVLSTLEGLKDKIKEIQTTCEYCSKFKQYVKLRCDNCGRLPSR
jgi:archaellum component FlaC